MRWPWFRVDVDDDAMRPTYLPGDRLLARRRGRRLRAGDVVVYRPDTDDQRVMVGRIVEAKDPARPTVAGDNPARGAASRVEHRIDRSQIDGRVVARLSGVDRPARRTYR